MEFLRESRFRSSTKSAVKCVASGPSILRHQYCVENMQQIRYTIDLRNLGKKRASESASILNPQSYTQSSLDTVRFPAFLTQKKAIFVALLKCPDKETRKLKMLSVGKETWIENRCS